MNLLDQKTLLILEVNDATLRLIHLIKKETTWHAEFLEEILLRPTLSEILQSRVFDIQGLGLAIQEVLRAKGIKTRKVVVIFKKELLTVAYLELPEIPIPEIRKIIDWEVEKYITFPREEAVFDFESKKLAEGKIEVQLVITQKELIGFLFKVLQVAKLSPLSIKLDLIPLPKVIDSKFAEILLENLKEKINLLPKRPLFTIPAKKLLVAPWVWIIIIMILATLGIDFRANLLERQLGTLEKRLAALDKEWLNTTQYQITLLEKINQSIPESVWLNSLFSDSIKREVYLGGLAINQSSVKTFIGNLSSRNFFSEVKLESIKETQVKDRSLINFRATAKF